MNETLLLIIAVSLLVLLFCNRWAHRSWGSAIAATIIAPIALLPIGSASFLLLEENLRNWSSTLSETADWSIPMDGTVFVAALLTGLMLLAGVVLYTLDQRNLTRRRPSSRDEENFRFPAALSLGKGEAR